MPAGTKLEPSWKQAETKLEPAGTSWNHLEPAGTKLEPSWNQAGTKLEPSWNQLEPAGTTWNQLEPSWNRAGTKMYVNLAIYTSVNEARASVLALHDEPEPLGAEPQQRSFPFIKSQRQ